MEYGPNFSPFSSTDTVLQVTGSTKNFFPVSDELQTICANNFLVTSAVKQTDVTVNTGIDKECSLIKIPEYN
jgi:hypothetical protein